MPLAPRRKEDYGDPYMTMTVESAAVMENDEAPMPVEDSRDTVSFPMAALEPGELMETAERATAFLKCFANSNRLMILCSLVGAERSVGELEAILGMRQPALSQQLARLREDDLVRTRRAGKMVFYSLNGTEAVELIGLLHRLFCHPDGSRSH